MSRDTTKRKISYRVALDGILGAVTLTLAALESLIPDIAFLPPGAKLGLPNIAIMFAVTVLGIGDGSFTVALKCGFVFLTRGPAAFFMSLAGSGLSFAALALIILISKKFKKEPSYIGVSVICAVLHNTGQVLAACVYTGTDLTRSYLPLMIIFGIISGMITGLILAVVIPVLINNNIFLSNQKGLK